MPVYHFGIIAQGTVISGKLRRDGIWEKFRNNAKEKEKLTEQRSESG